MTLTLIESYSNLNFEVTLFLIEITPLVTLVGSYPYPHLEVTPIVIWTTHFQSIGTVQFHPFLTVHFHLFLITHLLLRTFHFHSFLATHALLRAVKFHFLNRPLYVVLDRPP